MGESVRVSLACLDLAGTTVVDDEAADQATAEALATQGIVPGTEAYTRAMIRVDEARGRPRIDMFRQVFGDEDRARAANHSFERAYDSAVDRVGMAPVLGAEKAIDELAGAGVRICLITGFSQVTLGRIVDTLGWWKRADLLLCPSDVDGRGRPYPDMILTAALRLQIEDVRAIAVCGDTENDIHSGRRAGASIVAGTLTGAHDRERLLTAGATHVIDSIADLPDLILSPEPDRL